MNIMVMMRIMVHVGFWPEESVRKDDEKVSKEKISAEDAKLSWEEIKVEHLVTDEWIDFRRSAYRFPDGSVFEPFYSYSRRNFVVVVALDEHGDYICVRQFRQGIGKVTLEFTAGGIETGDEKKQYAPQDDGGDVYETSLEAAKRELAEETGYASKEWQHLLTVPSNPTIADNYAFIYVARNCRKVADQSLDETEFLNVKVVSEEGVREAIESGSFSQPIHILAMYLAKERR